MGEFSARRFSESTTKATYCPWHVPTLSHKWNWNNSDEIQIAFVGYFFW